MVFDTYSRHDRSRHLDTKTPLGKIGAGVLLLVWGGSILPGAVELLQKAGRGEAAPLEHWVIALVGVVMVPGGIGTVVWGMLQWRKQRRVLYGKDDPDDVEPTDLA